jgi:hypothetical protein
MPSFEKRFTTPLTPWISGGGRMAIRASCRTTRDMNEDSSAPADTFDAAAIAAALAGTWRFPAVEEPGGVGYLHFADRDRLFQVAHDPHHPAKRTFMRLQFSVESPYALRIRSQADPAGWICNYSFDGYSLTLLPSGSSFTCCRLEAEDVPDWFRGALAAGLAAA